VSQTHVVVVTKQSAYHSLIELRQDSRTLELLARHDPTVANFKKAHEEHEATVREVTEALQSSGVQPHIIEIPQIPFSIRGVSLVITVGGDGTLLAASHRLGNNIPVLGINSAPSTSVGFFCSLRLGQCKRGIRKALNGELPFLELSRMEVRLNGNCLSKRVLNEALFCHLSPAATTRYILNIADFSEEQKSSGFWIGPAAGSTAAQHSAGGTILPLTSKDLQLVVREPYLFAGQTNLRKTLIGENNQLTVFSKMQEAQLFLDGPHTRFEVGMGDRITFKRSPESLRVLGITRRRGRSH
jgi:NAD+ kinase